MGQLCSNWVIVLQQFLYMKTISQPLLSDKNMIVVIVYFETAYISTYTALEEAFCGHVSQ